LKLSAENECARTFRFPEPLMTLATISAADSIERGKHDKEGRQRALVEAATAVFAEHGYDAATTREVAERAGCSEGLIHRYFGSKRGLLHAVMEQRAAVVGDELRSALANRPDLYEDLRDMFIAQLELMRENQDFMRVSVGQAVVDPDLGRFVGKNVIARRREVIVEKLAAHQKAGRVRSDVDLEAVAQAITGLGFSLGFMAQVVFDERREHIEQVSLEAAEVFARGLAKDAAPR
jgi:AcrR family transcriptional regulator